MKGKIFSIIFLTMAAGLVFGNEQQTTVAGLSQKKDDDKVILVGHLVQQTASELYLFKDATGLIEVEIEAEDLHGISMPVTGEVKIFGELDEENGKQRIEVEHLELIEKPQSLITVRDLATFRDGKKVILEGVLVRELRSEHYLFRDKSGEVEVEIEKEDLPGGAPPFGLRVRIVGEVDKDDGKVSVEAEHLEMLK
jgi:uncharacterized protein (TIGR00156 family)